MRTRSKLVLSAVALALLAGAFSVAPSVGLYWLSNTDPTTGTGVPAPADQFLIRTDNNTLYYKSGTANTAWTQLAVSSGGDITGVTAGTSLTGGGTSGDVTLNVSLPGASCGASQAVTAVSADGTGTCSTVGDITGVTAGTSLTGGGTSGAVTLNVALPGASCAASEAVTALSAAGTGTCSTVGDITSVTAGTSLTGGGTSGAVTLNVALPGASCAAGTQVSAISAAGTGTCSADVTAVAAGTSVTASTVNGTATVGVNLPGGTCTGTSSVTSLSSAGTATCSTPLTNDPTSTGPWTWTDNGMSNCANNGNVGPYICSISGGTITQTIATATRPGIMFFSTSGSTTGRAGWITNSGALLLGAMTPVHRWVGGTPTLSTGTDEFTAVIGYYNTITSVNQTAAIGFLYDRGNVATGNNNTGNKNDWECFAINGTSRTFYVMDGTVVSDGGFTTVAAPVAALTLPNTNIQALEVDVNSAGTEADFYVTYNGGSRTKSCVITTNLPDSSHPFGWGQNVIKSAGTTAVGLYYDSSYESITLNSATNP